MDSEYGLLLEKRDGPRRGMQRRLEQNVGILLQEEHLIFL